MSLTEKENSSTIFSDLEPGDAFYRFSIGYVYIKCWESDYAFNLSLSRIVTLGQETPVIPVDAKLTVIEK